MTDNDQNSTDQQQSRGFVIQKIYIKDSSFEAPNSPAILSEQGSTDIKQQLRHGAEKIDENLYEVQLVITVTAKIKDKTAYLAEVHQAGLFTITGYSDDELEQLLAVYCARMLFPYASEGIANLVQHGGFPGQLLVPVNFDGLFGEYKRQQHIQQQSAGQAVQE